MAVAREDMLGGGLSFYLINDVISYKFAVFALLLLLLLPKNGFGHGFT